MGAQDVLGESYWHNFLGYGRYWHNYYFYPSQLHNLPQCRTLLIFATLCRAHQQFLAVSRLRSNKLCVIDKRHTQQHLSQRGDQKAEGHSYCYGLSWCPTRDTKRFVPLRYKWIEKAVAIKKPHILHHTSDAADNAFSGLSRTRPTLPAFAMVNEPNPSITHIQRLRLLRQSIQRLPLNFFYAFLIRK